MKKMKKMFFFFLLTNFTILCRSFEAPYLSDKTNRIKIGWKMKEKKQFTYMYVIWNKFA